MICGVDEAGRGPVIGPLVVAGVLVNKAGLEKLLELGVKDSKMHTPTQREALYEKIIGIAKCDVVKIPASSLDTMMTKRTLNAIEAEHFATIIERLKPSEAYIDSADVSCRNFEHMVKKHLQETPHLVVEHKADEKYPVVSAASIVAKVERDREIKGLHSIHGDFGSGYTSDDKTKIFLERCFRETRSFPDCVRRRWKTTQRLSNLKLEDFY